MPVYLLAKNSKVGEPMGLKSSTHPKNTGTTYPSARLSPLHVISASKPFLPDRRQCVQPQQPVLLNVPPAQTGSDSVPDELPLQSRSCAFEHNREHPSDPRQNAVPAYWPAS